MSETVVTVHETTTHTTGNSPRQVPIIKTEPGQSPGINLHAINVDYFRTQPGMLKAAQLFFGLIGVIIVGATSAFWFPFIGVIAFFITLFLVIIYALNLRESTRFPLHVVTSAELIYTAVVTILYFSGCLSVLVTAMTWAGGRGARIVGGVFGIFTTLAYGFGTYLLFGEYKNMAPQ